MLVSKLSTIKILFSIFSGNQRRSAESFGGSFSEILLKYVHMYIVTIIMLLSFLLRHIMILPIHTKIKTKDCASCFAE